MTMMLTTISGQVRRMRKLGPEQQRLLEGFRAHVTWRRDANWTWLEPSVALRLIESLERRGLVEAVGDVYKLTQRGLLEAARTEDWRMKRYDAFVLARAS